MVIDISKYQGHVDWMKLREWNNTAPDPLTAVYIKLNQGINAPDPFAHDHAVGAAKIGLPFGYYHFATLNKQDVVEDAGSEVYDTQATLNKLPKASLPIALDIETNEIHLKPDQILLWVQTFRKSYPSLVLYSGAYYLNENLPPNHDLGSLPLWVAAYTTGKPPIPRGWSTYYLHQYTDKGTVPGITGNVDISRKK